MVAFIYPEMNVLEGGLQKGSLSLICLLISSIVNALLLFTCQYSSISFFVSSLILLFKLLFRCLVSESFIRAFFDCSTTLYTLSTPILSLFDICFGLSLSTKYNSRSLDSTADFFIILYVAIGNRHLEYFHFKLHLFVLVSLSIFESIKNRAEFFIPDETNSNLVFLWQRFCLERLQLPKFPCCEHL